MIRPATAEDAPGICAIYNHHVEHTIVTFELEPVSHEEMAQRIEKVTASYPWVVAEEGGQVVGYAYARQFHERAAYRHTAEWSIFIADGHHRRGHARALFHSVTQTLRRMNIHVLIGGVSLPNAESVALHEALGFTKCAHYPEVGRKFDRWIDVACWALNLDTARTARSPG